METDFYHRQTTIKSRVSLSGVGVHSGKPATLHFNPADADAGISFKCQGPDGVVELKALADTVGATGFSTVLGNPAGVHVATVEHLMAALFGLGVDNVSIDIDGAEVPIMDGSSGSFVDAFDQAGIHRLDARRRFIRILKPVRIEEGASWAEFHPYSGIRFEVEIDFDSPAIGHQFLALDLTAESFRRDICRARTFGFVKDVDGLRAAGYARGASLDNTVVIGDDHRIVNAEGLRYANEFVRHKMLDAIGDLALAGQAFIGCFRSCRGGHKINSAALRRLLSDTSVYEMVEASSRAWRVDQS